MNLSLTKMHGLGNDFVVLAGPLTLSEKQITELCDRHFGVGADGLMIVSRLPSGVKMEYWNSDGSVAEMCGNGLRCVARFAVENDIVAPGSFAIDTPVGRLEAICKKDKDLVEVQVGKVMFEGNTVELCDMTFHTASVGNPHAITFVDDLASAPVDSVGPKVETDSYFPNKTNVEFARVVDASMLELRIWERGVGETLACGTGMVASAVVANKLGLTSLPVTMKVPGGEAKIWVDEFGYARISGPAVKVYTGVLELKEAVDGKD